MFRILFPAISFIRLEHQSIGDSKVESSPASSLLHICSYIVVVQPLLDSIRVQDAYEQKKSMYSKVRSKHSLETVTVSHIACALTLRFCSVQ